MYAPGVSQDQLGRHDCGIPTACERAALLSVGLASTTLNEMGMQRFRAIAMILVAISGVPAVALESAALPSSGSVEWAVALDAALRDAARAQSSEELIARSDRVLALYADCPPCRETIRERLRRRLGEDFRDTRAAAQVEEAGLSSDPLGLSSFLLDLGRHDEARRVAADHLNSSAFVDRRLELLSVLTQAQVALGDGGRARSAARRLLAEAPVSADYCRRAVAWWRLADDELARVENALDPPTYAAYVERVHELGRTHERTAYFGCHQSNLILDLASGQAGFPGGNVPADPVEALRLLAGETSDAKVRAAILLGAAMHRMYGTRGAGGSPAEALPLIRDAAASGDSASIQVGALDLERLALTMAYRLEEAGRVARTIVARYPNYLAACNACETDWSSLLEQPDRAAGVLAWSSRCRAILAECPDRQRLWYTIASSYGTAHNDSAQVYAALLAASPSDEVVPLLLLRQSDSVRKADPERAWTLERQALGHGSFPYWYAADSDRDGRRERAEEHEDFAAALVLQILSPPPAFGSCIPGDRTAQITPAFRQAYYRLRLGIEPGQQWTRLLDLLPSTPDDPSARTLHQPEYLDRLARAARVVHEEEAAMGWFRTLRQRYREARPGPGRIHSDPHLVELMLGGYIEELRSRSPESGSPSGTGR
jgi:hypothetical protein